MHKQKPVFLVKPDATYALAGGGRLWLWNKFLGNDASALSAHLHKTIPWSQPEITVFGKTHKVPRLQAWFGDEDARYRYSGLAMKPLPWPGELKAFKEQLEHCLKLEFNSVLANLYRDGQDAMGFHADDEPELGTSPWIASYSLGAKRRFTFKPKKPDQLIAQPRTFELGHDQLLLMNPAVQQHWKHGIARTKKQIDWRLNFTFRNIMDQQTD